MIRCANAEENKNFTRNHSKSLIKFNYTLTEWRRPQPEKWPRSECKDNIYHVYPSLLHSAAWNGAHTHTHRPNTIISKPNTKHEKRIVNTIYPTVEQREHRDVQAWTRPERGDIHTKNEWNERNEWVTELERKMKSEDYLHGDDGGSSKRTSNWMNNTRTRTNGITYKQNIGKCAANFHWKYVPSAKTFPFLYVSASLNSFLTSSLTELCCAGMNWCGDLDWDMAGAGARRTTNKSTHCWCTCCDCRALFHLQVFRVCPVATLKKLITFCICATELTAHPGIYILLKRLATNLWGMPFRYLNVLRSASCDSSFDFRRK